jgi:rubrerythrin
MDIFDYAIQMEKDGEAYYREIAESANDKGLKRIMTMLAEEEVKHAEVLEEMKSSLPDLGETTVLTDVKNIFAEMREKKEPIDVESPQVEMYKKAHELEEKSKAFYLGKSNETDNPAQKELLLKLADEERKHALILELIIEFVSKPDIWLENAEFHKLDHF